MFRAARAATAMVFIAGLLGLVVPAPGQSPLGEVAKEELSERAGIPADLLATMFVSDGPDQFILAFVATDRRVLDSELNRELKDGIRPFLDRSALLALVYPTRESRFDPQGITFAQGDARYLSQSDDIHPLTDNFRAGRLAAETLSAGVIELPEGVDDSSAFRIVFRGAFETTFRPTLNHGSSARSTRQTTALVRQDGHSWTMAPLGTTSGLDAVYRYENFQSGSPLVREDASVLFLHEGSDGALSLVVIHHARQPAEVRMTLWGVPTDAAFALQDDPDDAYWLAPPSAKATWRWSSGKTDGAALRGLVDGTSLSITPEFNGSLSRWFLVRGSLDDPEYVELPSTSSPLQLAISRVNGAASESEDDEGSSSGNSDDAADLSVDFAFNSPQPTVGESVTFTADTSGAPSEEIVEYAWDFDGDGRVDERRSQPSTTHMYRSAGTYRVELRVTDERDRTATAARTIDVRQAEAPASVDRVIGAYLPGSEALPGTAFHVRLVVNAHRRTVGLGIRERPPDGWTLTLVENAGAEFNRELSEWLFTDPLAAGETRTILYRVDVPDHAELGTARFSGQAVSGVPSMEMELAGDDVVDVVRALVIPVAVSRLNEDGRLDLRLSNFITFDQILQATVLWKEQAPVPGTDGRAIDLPTMVTLVAHWRTGTPIDQPLPADAD